MNLRVKLLTAACALMLPFAALGIESRSKLEGRIIAYRPVDRLFQMASFVPNKEIYLLKLENSKSEIIKIEYQHFGFTPLNETILDTAPLVSFDARRDKSCDQTFEQFVSTAPKLRPEGSDSPVTDGIAFTERFKSLKIAPDMNLRCYVTESDPEILRKNYETIP